MRAASARWVSAKQSGEGTPDRRLRLEGSSQFAAAWLQSHPSADSFICDGEWHTGTFGIDPAEQGWGELNQGHAWVQFCLFGRPPSSASPAGRGPLKAHTTGPGGRRLPPGPCVLNTRTRNFPGRVWHEPFKQDGQTLIALERRLPRTRFGVMRHLRVLEEAALVTTSVAVERISTS
jgi:hypothetical protein